MDPAVARRLLEAERDRLEDLRRVLTERSLAPGGTGAEATAQDQHPADVATETFEREKDLSILERIDAELRDVDVASERLDGGRYGACESCGAAIPDERLEVLPAARLCVDDQVQLERTVREARVAP